MATITDNFHEFGNRERPCRGQPRVQKVDAEPTCEEIAAEAAAIYPDTFPTAPTPEQIAAEAYAIYMARGCDDGRDMDDWYEAERKLRRQAGP